MNKLHGSSMQGACVLMKDASSLSPFDYGVEYNSPARGSWNIVHVGMLLPQSHQIYVCAQSCLRGVVLTAAELGAMNRFSTVTIEEEDVLDGDIGDQIIDGVADILDNLLYTPRAVLVYTSCIHHFLAVNLNYVYKTLSERYKDIEFADCYMNPIMRKSKLTPDATMRRQLYRLLRPSKKCEKQINLIGNNTATDDNTELITMLKAGGYSVMDICNCKTYDEFLMMADSQVNISFHEAAIATGEDLQIRLDQKHLHLSASYDYKIIRDNLTRVCEYFHIQLPDFETMEIITEEKIKQTARQLGKIPIAIDYTAVDQPLGLAKLLIEHGFNVVAVYADNFSHEQEEAFNWLKNNAGDLKLYATVHWKMRVAEKNVSKESKILAIGQKAAYFTGTNYFVNLIENDGCFGYHGIRKLMDMILEAAYTKKDMKNIIQVKGWGCCG